MISNAAAKRVTKPMAPVARNLALELKTNRGKISGTRRSINEKDRGIPRSMKTNRMNVGLVIQGRSFE